MIYRFAIPRWNRTLLLSSTKRLRAQLFQSLSGVFAVCLFMLGSYMPSVAQVPTVYHPHVPSPANPAMAASPREDWYISVQQKFDRYSGKHADIVFDGDSITNRWETTGKSMWARYADRAADFGIEGDRTENLLWRLSKGQVDGVDPKVVVLLIGTNNVGRDSADHLADGIKAVVAEYKKRCPHAHIILMAVFPRAKTPDDPSRLKLAAVNRQIATLDDGHRVSFIDIGPKLIEADGTISPETMPDFVHPTANGYSFWADAIQPLIDKYAPPAPAN
jgi:lysophospholipase L1-like esterase